MIKDSFYIETSNDTSVDQVYSTRAKQTEKNLQTKCNNEEKFVCTIEQSDIKRFVNESRSQHPVAFFAF